MGVLWGQLIAGGHDWFFPPTTRLLIGMSACGRASGAVQTYSALLKEVKKGNLPWKIDRVGCIGLCSEEPLVALQHPGKPLEVYGPLLPNDMIDFVETCRCGGIFEKKFLGAIIQDDGTGASKLPGGVRDFFDHPFYQRQSKVVSRNSGLVSPLNIEAYVFRGGYRSLFKLLTAWTGQQVIEEVVASGLRGRGGAGFPTGQKWAATAEASSRHKFVICNADEGNPGAYMDGSLLEGDPHSVLEGMAIGAYAMGAQVGYIYIRDEYPVAERILQAAISQANRQGFLGHAIMDTDFNFHVYTVRGAGAYVCGEETALISSIEGQIGEPRIRPPFPAEKGLWDSPTCVNNVETWANIPLIMEKGAGWYKSLGRAGYSSGTRLLSVVGCVRRPGLIEVPMGVTIREIINQMAGGPLPGRRIKAVQSGGPGGGFLPSHLFDIPLDYETLSQAGSGIGSGGMVVLDDECCIVDMVHYFVDFSVRESCGKCIPCREGLPKLQAMVQRILSGQGKISDLDEIIALSGLLQKASFCGHGKTAVGPVLSGIKYFRNEFIEHIEKKQCSPGVCPVNGQ